MSKETIDNSGPAFPVNWYTEGEVIVEGGMTLRDYFAGQALSGYCANPDVAGTSEKLARWSYQEADAMLKERQVAE